MRFPSRGALRCGPCSYAVSRRERRQSGGRWVRGAQAPVFGHRLHPASRHGGVPGNLDTLGAVAGGRGRLVRRFCPRRDA